MAGEAERRRVKRDGFVLTREEHGEISCERIQSRAVPHIAVHDPRGFGVGSREGWGAADLSIAILAALLDASRDPEAYREPPEQGNERHVWELHRAFCARWITPLVLGPGEYVELPTSRLEDWLATEGPLLTEPQ
jgi:hypothetical protein